MRINHVRISNILGVEQLEFSPAGFTRISGPNGAGKTSVLEAIRAATGGGHDATLLRKGAAEGEIVLVLDDGSSIEKKVTATGSAVHVRDTAGKRISRPVDHLRRISDALSVNPVDFLRADKKDRVRVLLSSLPLEVDEARLSELSGIEVRAQPGVHALTVIDQVHQQVFDERTALNRDVRGKAATTEQPRAAIPPLPEGADGNEEDLELAIRDADAARENMHSRIDAQLNKLRTELDTACAAIDDQIEDLRAQAETLKADRLALQQAFQKRSEDAHAAKIRANDKHSEETTPVRVQLRAIRNDRDVVARRAQTEETIAAMVTEHATLAQQAEEKTERLSAIATYRAGLLKSLPIAGLELIDGDVQVDGVPLDRVNTAKQVDVAVEIAKVRAGELGIICVDRIESLDPDMQETFRAKALESGLQMFVTAVTDGDFAIDSSDE